MSCAVTERDPAPARTRGSALLWAMVWAMAWTMWLSGCGSAPRRVVIEPASPPPMSAPAPGTGVPSPVAPRSELPRSSGGLAGAPGTPSPQQPIRSRWVAVPWSELPGWQDDDLQDAWNAWLQNCARPGPLFAPLCQSVRTLSLASDDERRLWMMANLQPYRVESLEGQPEGLLTSYYEPLFDASLQPRPGFEVPLYAPPEGLDALRRSGRAWFTRQEIETAPQAREALRGREVAWLADPVDALVLHIQGSGRLRVPQPDGTVRTMRLAFAGSNEQPYASVGRWLLDRGLVRDASWPGIKAWIVSQQASAPQRVQEMFWSNPRYVFFREETRSPAEADLGPRGAQGVPLTPGRSIAVDKESIPYATPLWLASTGPSGALRRLVFAQDTGSAIVGAVRADYFAGTGAAAGDWAGRVKQGLRLWVLWPK